MIIERASRRSFTIAALLVLAGLLIGSATTASGTDAQPRRAMLAAASSSSSLAGAPDTRPNIVFISTDDQRIDDMRYMPFTRALIGGHGVTFTRALSPHPLCCPARAEFVTGQYAQNNGVSHNHGVRGGYQALIDPGNTLAAWLHDAGYQTAMVGKYLNGYGQDSGAMEASIPAWDRWNPSVAGVYSYLNTTFYNDGRPVVRTQQVDDVVASFAQRYIRRFSANDKPFYVWASNLAPHSSQVRTRVPARPIPATRHRLLFPSAKNPARSKASFGKRVVDGDPVKPFTENNVRRLQAIFLARIRSLQAVDEGVRSIVLTLRETGELANTYLVVTTDNGFLLGEHGLVSKNYLFEEDLRVPMLVRVPRAKPTTSSVPVTVVDIAATVADLAGVAPGRTQDGVSFAPLLTGQTMPWRDTQLIETGLVARDESNPGWHKRGVRTSRWTYGRDFTDGSIELYDRKADPLQLVNLANRPRYAGVVAELERRSALLGACTGTSCNQVFGPVPEPIV